MIDFKKVELVLDNYYFCQNVDKDLHLFHLVDDSFLGFILYPETNKISLFNYYDCDFDKKDEIEKSAKYWNYDIPETFEDLLDLLFKHELLSIYEDNLDDCKTLLINNYYNKTIIKKPIRKIEDFCDIIYDNLSEDDLLFHNSFIRQFPLNYKLVDCLKVLKIDRSEEDIKLINQFIEIINNNGRN